MLRHLCIFIIVAAALACASCRATVRPKSNEVLALLGKTAGIDAGKCSSPGGIKEAYLQEIENKPTQPLADTLIPFAQRAAKICPQAHPYIRTTNDVDVKTVAAMLDAASIEGDGKMQMESWLWLRVAGGKVIGLEVDLEKF
ncbi:MAG: hypothetical protein ABI811_08135 [Acidobacteriota bacterium]